MMKKWASVMILIAVTAALSVSCADRAGDHTAGSELFSGGAVSSASSGQSTSSDGSSVEMGTQLSSSSANEQASSASGKPASSTPAKPASSASAKPTSSAPAKPASSAPAKPASSTPAKPASSAPAKPVSSTPSKPEEDKNDPTEEQEDILRLVNQERAKEGLAPLKLHAKLCEAAQIRAEEIVSLFEHTRPDGTDCFTVLQEYGISYRGAGENIAYGSGTLGTAESIMDAWMKSQGHRANILKEDFNYLGVGCFKKGNVQYWVQLFIFVQE